MVIYKNIQIDYHFVLLMVDCKYYEHEDCTNASSDIDIDEIRVIDSEYDIYMFFTHNQIEEIKELVIKIMQEYY